MSRIRDVGLRFAAALTCGLLSASLVTSCTKGTKNAAGVRASASNWRAVPEAVKNMYPPNQTILDPIKFVVSTKEGSPVPNINVEFKAFDVTPAFNGGVSTEAMKGEILTKWSDGNFVMNSKGSIAGNTCDAGFTRDVCAGQLSGPSKVTNQNGEATVGFTTPNAPGGVMAIAMRVPQDSTASELIEMVLIKITSNDDFVNSGIEPIQSAFIVVPLLFDNDGRQVIQAGVPFNLAIYAPGIPNTAPGKGFMFDFVTEGLQDTPDGSTVVVPTGSKRCEFRNSQCIVPGGPFRVLKPTTLSFSARPSDPKFPVKPASFSIPVITGQASQLIVALSPDTRNIQNACADSDLLNKPCIIMSADDDKKELYPMLIDAGGNWVESPDTVWSEITGPLAEAGRIASSIVTTGKQTLYPLKASDPTSQGDTIKVSVKGKPIYMYIKYLVTPGKPKKLKITNTRQRATVPFPAVMELRDRYGNFCYQFNDQIAMKLSLSPLTDVVVSPLTGLVKTASKVATLDHTGDKKITFTNGVGRTSEVENTTEGFVVTKVPPSTDITQWPRISVDEATTTAGVLNLDIESVPLLITPGPVVQTLWRDKAGGGGSSWNEVDLDPVIGYSVPSDRQLNFHLAGYDAAANFVSDVSDAKFWGVAYTLDDKDPTLASAFKAATDRLFNRNPSDYSSPESCPKPQPKTPYAGRPKTGLPPDDQAKEDATYGVATNQPEGNNVFCGIHLGLNNRGGSSSVTFNSKGISGTGRILAIPNGMYDSGDLSSVKIRPALSPRLSLVAGAATQFTFEFISADSNVAPGTVIYRVGSDDLVPTGHKFKIRIHAQDSDGTDSPSYKGVKTLQVRFTGEKSWGGIAPVLPSGDFDCEFGKEFAGVCEVPGTYMLADARTSALLVVKQTTEGGIQGTFAKIIGTQVGSEQRLFFANQKGGPAAGAVVESSLQYPLGRTIKADKELPLAVAVTDAGGSYIRDAVAGDGLVYDGFRSDDGIFKMPTDAPDVPPVFVPQTGAWRNSTAWNTSYNLYDVFTADNSNPQNPTPAKFYNPDYAGTPQQITDPLFTDVNKYTTVFVPQNRFGKGFAVPRSTTNPQLIGWPSSWWNVTPGDPEHIETKLVRSGAPDASWTKPGFESATAEQKTNWVSTSDTCYDVVITIHDKKHNQLANYTGVVPNVVFKMINTTPDKPNGVDDLQAGIFAENYRNNSVPVSYYQPHNQVFVPGPFRDGFYLSGMTENDGGLFNFSKSSENPTEPSLNDWLMTRVTVTTGVITTGVKVCLYNGQTQANRTSAVPYLEKFIQVDMPSFTPVDGKDPFPAFQSRGAGITFTGADNKLTGSSASPHTHGDKLTVFRSTAHHLHPTFDDSVTQSQWGAYYAGIPPVIGVSDLCYAYKCGKTQIYWHEHDVAHNFVRPARTDGFETSSNLLSGAKRGADGALGSPSSVIFDVGDSRQIPQTPNGKTVGLMARNNFINWLSTGGWFDPPDYRYGASINLMAGPPKTMDVSRLGTSSLTTDAPFGLRIALYDEFGNPSGAQNFSRSDGDRNGAFGIDRTLEVRFDQQPSNGPTSGNPRLMGRSGTDLANASNPVSRLVQPTPSTDFLARDFAASNDADNILLVKANESRNLLLTLKDSRVIPWCAAGALNCCFESESICESKKNSPRSISATFPVNAQPGLATGTVLTFGTGPTAIQYPAQGSADPLTAYNAIFNTNPTAGATYPLGVSLTRTFKTNACATDQYGNIGECDTNAQFYVDGATNPSPLHALSPMLNVISFNWRATKPGTFALKAVKNGFTAITAPISVASQPLNAFSFENVTTTQDVPAGSEFQVKVCMIDEATNVITTKVFNDQGEVVTDPEATLPVGFSLFGLIANPEGKTLQLSTGSGTDFEAKKIDLAGASVKFTQGCTNLYAQIYAKGSYNSLPLLTMTYIDPMQSNKPFSGSGITVNSVVPGNFDHYGTKIAGAPVLAGASVVPALSNPNGPGVNVKATTTGGNRFDLTVYARDVYGNDIAYNSNFTIGLQLQGTQTPSSLQLTCAAPQNDNVCLTRSMAGAPVTVANLAMDIPGSYFVFAKNSDESGISLENSAMLTATASLKTIKEYRVDAPTIHDPELVYFTFSVSALDNKGNPISGIQDLLNSPSLNFTWIDESGQPLSTTHLPPYGISSNPRYTSACVPTLNRPVFDPMGVARFGYGFSTLKLTKTGPLKLNIRDSQAPSVSSNNLSSTEILNDKRNFDVTCTKVSDGSDCTGTAANPVIMDASPENRFNLTVKTFDNCGNKTVGSNQVWVTGAASRFEALSAPNITYDAFVAPMFIMGGNDQGTFNDIFSRSLGTAAYGIDDRAIALGTPTWTKTYHSYRATLASVCGYSFENVSTTTPKVGEAVTFKLRANDCGTGPRPALSGIDSLLNGQTYTWVGGSVGPNNQAPSYPPSTNLGFVNGVTGPLSVTFTKAEQILDFYVIDNFVKGPSGVIAPASQVGQDPTGKRRSTRTGSTNPIVVSEGLPSKFVLSAPSTTVKAGSSFNVTVTVFDKYNNLVTNFGSDTLTFSWSGASPSVTNPVTAAIKPAEVLAPGSRTFDVGTASFTTTGSPFTLYRSNANALAPQEQPTLTVTGAKTGAQTETGQPLTASLTFTVQPSDTIAYAKVADASTFDATSDFTGKGLTMSNDQTKIFFGHLFDPWGNYKGTSPLTAWTGSGALDGKLAPTPSLTTTLSPTTAGTGVVTASCADVAPGCVSGSTGTISVDASPLKSFGVTQVSPAEGANVTAGDEVALKVCMLDRNQQVITNPVVVGGVTVTDPNGTLTGLGITSSVHILKNAEEKTQAVSLGSGAQFNPLVFGSNSLTFTNGCVNLYARVYAAGTYGLSKPLVSFAYTDTKQNNLPIGGSGLKLGTVAPAALDHYNTLITESSLDGNNASTGRVPAWSNPGSTNSYASAGGNRFGIDLRAIDAFGNLVPVTKSVTLGLVKKSDMSALSNQRLTCAAPSNNQACLTIPLSNAATATVPWIGIDIPGEFFISATDGSKSWSTTNSQSFTAVPSAKTVKNYALTAPASAVAGQDTPIRIEARDAADQVITGADTELRGLTFGWQDGSGVALTTGHISPALTAPIVPSSLQFNAGVANVNITLTKAESGLQINVKDNQTTSIASNNTTLTTVSPGSSLYYAITCAKVTGGADCTGISASNAASMWASPSDMFNLQLKAFDQYQNPKSDGATSPAIKLTWESGNDALNTGVLEQVPLQNALDADKQVVVPMSGQSQRSVLNLFHRAGAHVLSMSVDPISANYVGMSQKTFHSYQAHIDMVTSYDFSPNLNSWTSPLVAGAQQNFTLRAFDQAGNVAKGIDTQLNAQRYLWRGPAAAPNGDAPVLPGPMTGTGGILSFSGGQVTGLSANFKNAETIADFHMVDNYTPGPSGVGGRGPSGVRRSVSSTNALTVINATPTEYVLSTVSATVQAGAKFDVQVLVRDQFQNPAKTWTSDFLTFTWDSGGSSTPSNPSTGAMSADVSPAGLRTFAADTATVQTADQRFVLYKAPEPSVLKVTGQTPRATAQPVLSGTLAFTPTVSSTPGYVKIASSATFDGTTSLSGVGFSMATNDSRTLYAHLFDPFGNYSGNTSPVSWSGTDKLANKMTPTSAAVTTLTATEVGTGFVTASCTALNANCKQDTTGIVSVGASPLKSFVIEHTGTGILAEGGTVPAGTEIPMRVCMVDSAGQRITQDVYVNGVLRTQAGTVGTPVSLPLTFSDLNVKSVGPLTIDYSTGTGASYTANRFTSGAVNLPFIQGCAAFNAKLFATNTYNGAALLNITHTATLQGGITVLGTGLKVQAVTPLGLDHFRPIVMNAASTPQANSVPAWGIPGPNVYAKDGGSKFDVRVFAEDLYGNSVTVSGQSITLSTYAADRVTPRTRTLICPGTTYGDTSCLTQTLTGSAITFSNLAIDVGGFTFYPYASSGGIGSVLDVVNSAAYAVSSEKTVAQYVVTAPSSVTAGSEFTVGIAAKDATGANVQGADAALSGLSFSWLDGATPTKLALSTHTAPGGQAPAGVSPGALSFSGGSASRKITLTKVETGLKINVADNQSTSVTSNTSSTTDVGVGGQTWYELTCSRVSDGSDCTGTSGSPVAMTGSAADKYSLTIKVYDQYKNPKTITANPQLQVTRVSGAALTGPLEQHPLVLSAAMQSGNLIVPISGVETIVQNLFRRSAAQTVSIGIAAASTTVDGMYTSVYHSYTPTIDSVYSYFITGLDWNNAQVGVPYQVTISAIDRGGNAISGIAAALNSQSYSWTGIGVAPNGQAPTLPGVTSGNVGPVYAAPNISFDNTGVVATRTLTFTKSETLLSGQYQFRDNYNGTGGNGGIDALYRQSPSYGNIAVKHAAPSQYSLSAASTTPAAGSGFDVTVTALDDYLNPATSWTADTLTFSWSGASNSITNPKTATVFSPGLPATNPVSATFTNGVFSTSGAPFKLYRSNLYALTPQEVSTLTVNGSVTNGTKSGTALSKTLNFTTQPAAALSYVKIAKADTFSDANNMSGQALTFSNNQTLNLYAHMFDAFGNYKGNSTSLSWSGNGALSANVSPTTGTFTTVTPAATGTGKIFATCSTSITGCIDDQTGDIGVKSAPLASFSIEHASSPLEGAAVTAGDEIPLKICMRDSKNQVITQTVVDGNNNTITNPDASLTLTFAAINITNTAEKIALDLSTLGGVSYSGAAAGARAVQFAAGCSNFFGKVYKAGTFGATLPLLSVTYSDPLQSGITISGSGLKLASVAAKTLDHYVTSIGNLAQSPQPNTTQAWSAPGSTNQYAIAGGNRFDVTVRARDMYGNPASLSSQTVNLSLQAADGSAVSRSLICVAPTNNSACLNPAITNSDSVTVGNLAIDIGGQFYIKATDANSTPFYASTFSTFMTVATSRRTVKEYFISAPSTAVAGVGATVTITARDNAGATVVGADADITAAGFDWTDGVNLLSSRIAPDGLNPPILPSPVFSAGTATVSLTLVKAENLTINIRDKQTTPVSSTNAVATSVSAGTVLKYDISCTKDTGGDIAQGGDCTGLPGTPASILASATDRFSLNIRAYDQYKNPRASGNTTEVLQVDYISSSTGATNPGFLEQTPLTLSKSGNDLIVNTNNVNGVTISNLFHRGGNHVVSYSIASSQTGMWGQTYHDFKPSRHMVASYSMTNIPDHIAGTARTFKITAVDRAGNVARNIDSDLNAQAYTWLGAGSPLPDYPSTAAGGISFTDGQSQTLSVTFKKAETVGFYVQDNYNPASGGVAGIGGSGTGGARRSGAQTIVVSNALANSFFMTPTTANPQAGVGFGVTVLARDIYGNTVTNYATDALTFSWSGASSSVTNPKNPTTTFSPISDSRISGTMTSGQYTSGNDFFLYRTGESPILTVAGSSLSTSVTLTPIPNANHGYVIVTPSGTYQETAALSGARDIFADQSYSLFAHMFDAYGNYKGNTFSVSWTGSDALAGKLTPSGLSSTLSPTLQGTGTITANCSALTTGCTPFTTGLQTVKPGNINKLVWLPSPTAISQTTEQCIKYTIEAQDNNNNPVQVSANTGITFTSTGGNGEFYSSLPECENAQTGGGTAGAINYAIFNSATSLSPNSGGRIKNILKDSSTVDVWYANRTPTAANGVTINATNGSASNTRTGQITAGASRRVAFTSAAPTINAAGSASTTCAKLDYAIRDAWDNATTTSGTSEVNISSSSSTGGTFHSDAACSQQTGLAVSGSSATQTLNTGSSAASIYYKDSRANNATVTIATAGSTLSGNALLDVKSLAVNVNPGPFNNPTPAIDSPVKTGFSMGWDPAPGAQNYTVIYHTSGILNCSGGTSVTTATNSVTLSISGSATYYICVIANGFSASQPQTNMTSNGTYKVVVDNTIPTAAITAPAASVTQIGPATTAMGTGSTTIFAGNASDALSGLNKVEVSLLRSSDSKYWDGSGFTSAGQLWVLATGTSSWSYTMNDASFTAGSYTLSVRSTDNSQNQSVVGTKTFTWKQSVSDARFASGAPSANSKWTALSTNTGVQIGSDDSLVTHYKYAVVSGTTCTGATYSANWIAIATKITDTLPTADGSYTLCALGRDEAENEQTAATSLTWTKDTANPIITMPSTPTVNAAFTASPTITDADSTLTYAWAFNSGSRCSGATFGTPSAASTTITATGCTTNNWGSVTVSLTVTDRATNSTTQNLTVQWDQQGAAVSSIASTLTAGSSCRVGFCGATTQSSIPINIVFTKESGNWNRSTFSLTVSGSPTMNLNIKGTGGVTTRTATLANGTYTNDGLGFVTVPATYTVVSGDGDTNAGVPSPGGVVLNVDSAAPFNSPSSIKDSTGTSAATGTAIANSGVPTSGSSSLQNSNITIDTTAPTPTVVLAGPAAQTNFVGFVNDTNKSSTSALSAAATANETLSSTVQARYVLIATATTCDSSTTGVSSTLFSTTIPTPSSTGMSTLTDNSTYNICIEATDRAGNVGYAKGPNIVLDRTRPSFTSINVPVTQVNNTNSSSTDAIGNNISATGADATSVTAITYAATKTSTCDGTLTYGSMPTITSGLTSDGIWYLCVRLIDRANNIVYEQAASTINRQTVAAQLTAGTFQWTGDAANYFLNIDEKAQAGAILTAPTATRSAVLLSLPASSFTYATTSTTSTNCSDLTTWSSTLPNKTTFTTSGTYKACVKITDDAGNVSYAATSDGQTLVVDLAAPTLTFNLANAAVNGYVNADARSSTTQLAMATESSISADMVAGSKRYKVIASTTTCDNAAVGSSTQTTIPTPSSTDFSGQGTYKICMMAQDTAGNVGYVASGDIVLDTVLPTLGTLSLANAAVGGYINDSEKALTTALVSYSGGDGTNAVYQVTTTATTAANCSALAAGSYSSTVPTPNGNLASDATYRVCVRVQDAALNYSYAISSDIIRDTSLPTRTSGFDWINDASNFSSFFINAAEKTAANPILSVAVTSDGTIEYAIGTAATCAAMTGYSTTLVNMSNIGVDNTYRACVRMTDVAGNVDYYSPANTLVVDTVTPTLAFSTNPPGNRSRVGATDNTSFTIQPTTTDTAKYYYSVTAGNNSCAGQTYTAVANTSSVSINISGLADGTITLCTQAEDAAGNRQSAADATVSQWIKDTVAPAAMTITGPASQVSTSTPTVTWTTPAWVTASDNHTIELYIATNSTCTVGNRLQSYASIAGVANTTQTQALTALNDGLYYICMYVSDQATNKSGMITSSFEVETDIVHFSYTNSNSVMYARYQNLAWTSETVAANASGITYDDRTSLQLDNSGTPFVSYKVDDGTNTSFRYSSRNGANSWATASTVQTIASATSTDVGNFNEIAINTLPRVVSAFIGRFNSDYGLYVGVNIGDGGASQVAGSPGQFTDAAVAVGPSSNTLFAAAAQSGTLVMVVRDTSTATIPAANLPSGCSVQKVSAVAKSDSVVSVALVCSFASSCGVRYADITYSGGTFTSPASASWTSVGTIKSSSCAGLADSERPTIMVDRQNSNAVGIAWESQGGTNYVNFWTNRSGSGVNTQVVSGASAFSEQSLAFDSFGNAYIAYKDGNTFKIVTNNNGSWVSSTAVSGGGLSAIGSIGITGMKGRGNTTSGK